MVKTEKLCDLGGTIAKFITPRLKEFRRVAPYCPTYFYRDLNTSPEEAEEAWHSVLDSMILAFELALEDDIYDINSADGYKKEYTEGINNFSKLWLALWW